jgi:hypothetical protein
MFYSNVREVADTIKNALLSCMREGREIIEKISQGKCIGNFKAPQTYGCMYICVRR